MRKWPRNGSFAGLNFFGKEGRILKNLRIIGMVAVMLLVAAPAAFAAEGGEFSRWWDFLWRVITFLLVVLLIQRLAGKRIKEFFTGRSYQIKAELDDLEVRKTEAEKKLREVERAIANLDKEREEILEGFKREGEKLKAAIVANAEANAQKIKAQAEVSAAQEAKLAVDAMKAEMAEKIVEAAEKLFREKLTKADHEKLVEDYLTKVVLN
jgi:F-type H+-transporting ATPase subunit b